MSAEICVADRELAESEIAFLDDMQKTFALDDLEAKDAFESARKHSGLLTLEEKSDKVRTLMPAFVRGTALMAPADAAGADGERPATRSVLRAMPDMGGLTHPELDEAIDVAFERISGKSSKAELEAVAAEVDSQSDRYWVTVYVMIIALADGKQDWREVEFLANLKSTFKLGDSQMDAAMQTASQFPAVKLGGDAPD